MKTINEKILKLTIEFQSCQNVFTAIGDEQRQHILLKMMTSGAYCGMRVGEITKMTNLSRPALSHHLGILKRAGVIAMRKEGTKNYYYIDPNRSEIKKLQDLFIHAQELLNDLPDRSRASAE